MDVLLQIAIDKNLRQSFLEPVKVLLPSALEDFVTSQVKSGEFDSESEVVSEAIRLLREKRENKAMEEMRAAFANVDASNGRNQPTPKDRLLINQMVKAHRARKREQ